MTKDGYRRKQMADNAASDSYRETEQAKYVDPEHIKLGTGRRSLAPNVFSSKSREAHILENIV